MMNPQERFWKVASVAGIVLAVFLAVVSIKEIKSIGYVGKSDQLVSTISVNGKGEVVAIPDIATFSFSVTESAKTVADAQQQATQKTNATLKVVRDAGIDDKDIQTLSYAINPRYEYQSSVCPLPVAGVSVPCRPGKSVLTGYEVSQTIQVKIRDLSKAGSIFTSIGSLGVQNVQGLNFSVDDIEKVKAEARAQAIADAQMKAKMLSKDLDVKILRVTSFYDNNDQPIFYGFGGDSREAKTLSAGAPTPEIPAGEHKVVSNVTITYEIK